MAIRYCRVQCIQCISLDTRIGSLNPSTSPRVFSKTETQDISAILFKIKYCLFIGQQCISFPPRLIMATEHSLYKTFLQYKLLPNVEANIECCHLFNFVTNSYSVVKVTLNYILLACCCYSKPQVIILSEKQENIFLKHIIQ